MKNGSKSPSAVFFLSSSNAPSGDFPPGKPRDLRGLRARRASALPNLRVKTWRSLLLWNICPAKDNATPAKTSCFSPPVRWRSLEITKPSKLGLPAAVSAASGASPLAATLAGRGLFLFPSSMDIGHSLLDIRLFLRVKSWSF